MAEGRVFVEPRGTAREPRERCGRRAAAPSGDGGTGAHGARRVSRAFLLSLSPASGAGVWNAIPMATPLRRSGTPGEPGGPWRAAEPGRAIPCRNRVQPRGPQGGREASLIARGAGTAGEVTLLLRKSKLLSWHVLRPEGVHPSPAEEPGTLLRVRRGESRGCDWPAGTRCGVRTPLQPRHPRRLSLPPAPQLGGRRALLVRDWPWSRCWKGECCSFAPLSSPEPLSGAVFMTLRVKALKVYFP